MYEWNKYFAENDDSLIVLLNRLERSEEMPDYVYAPTPERQTWLVLARKLANRNRAGAPARGADAAAEPEAENVED